MRLEYLRTVKSPKDKVLAYLHDLSAYCHVHSLKGSEWVIQSPDTFKQVMSMGPIGKVECVYQVTLTDYGVCSQVISGEGKGTQQSIQIGQWTPGYTEVTWMLEPNLDGGVSQAILRILKEKKLAKMMQKALEKSAQVDVDYLEKGA